MYGLYSIGIHVKCILMQWPKGNKEYKPPLRENRSFLLIYVQRVLEASSLRVYGFLIRHSFEFIHLGVIHFLRRRTGGEGGFPKNLCFSTRGEGGFEEMSM